jgi:hypothetical protein
MTDPDDDVADDGETWSEPGADDEVAAAIAGFSLFVRLSPDDAALAHLGVAAIVRSLSDYAGPDAPTPGMMGVPALIEDGLARAALADASPSARDVLADLERAVVQRGPTRTLAAAERIRAAIRAANARLAGGASDPGAF